MHQKTVLENLQLAIHGVTAPFFCDGTFAPDNPVVLVFKDGVRCEVVRAKNAYEQKDQLKVLLEHCEPAPFGDGKKTRYDRRVRDAFQLKAEKNGFSVENFDPESAGILDAIRRQLVPHAAGPISAELYTVNVYTDGGHFKPHKDTPRGKSMFGTLVVCLPSQFVNGDLVLSHRGVVREVAWGRTIADQKNPNRLHWAAFFGDVDHEIEKVWQGARVTLTYLLRHGNGASADTVADQDLAPRVQEAWRALLADKSFLPKGGILGYPCSHLYHQDARFQSTQKAISKESAAALKGRDHLVAATALAAGLKVAFAPYMFENCADETWQLKRFPTPAEQKNLGWQMDASDLQEALPIRASSEDEGDFGVTWIEPPPTSENMDRSKKTTDPELPVAARLHSCDYCAWGYFGNESSEIDLYTYAALHIKIPPLDKRRGVKEKPTKSATAKRARSSRGKRTKQE